MLNVSPDTGTAFDRFTLTTSGWTTSSLPLTYRFLVRPRGSDDFIELTTVQSESTVETILPAATRVRVEVYDSKGVLAMRAKDVDIAGQ